jgi:hypothetical protein
MTALVSSFIQTGCDNFVSSFMNSQIKVLKKEFMWALDALHVGGEYYRYNGPGDKYLREKSFYIAPNSWDFAKSLFCCSILASVGLLIALCSFPGSCWIGGGIIAASAYYILAELKEGLAGNHLKKALELIAPFDQLPQVNWEFSKLHEIQIDPKLITEKVMKGLNGNNEVEVIVFKLPPHYSQQTDYHHLIKVYYLGQNNFKETKGVMKTVDGIAYRFECNNLLAGSDIDLLMQGNFLTNAECERLKARLTVETNAIKANEIIMLLHHNDGWPHKRIAEALYISEEKVKTSIEEYKALNN